MVLARIAGSSARGMPAFTSSMCAPASTWAMASRSTRLKSPAFISSARSFRPVGLMRSPMIANGRSKPMTTSRVAELTTVCVARRALTVQPVGARSQSRPFAAGGDQAVQDRLRVHRLEAGELGVGFRLDVRAALALGPAHLLDVVAV